MPDQNRAPNCVPTLASARTARRRTCVYDNVPLTTCDDHRKLTSILAKTESSTHDNADRLVTVDCGFGLVFNIGVWQFAKQYIEFYPVCIKIWGLRVLYVVKSDNSYYPLDMGLPKTTPDFNRM